MAAREVGTRPSTEADIRDIEEQIEVWAQTDTAIDEPGAINHEFEDILEVLHEFTQDVLEQLGRHELRQRPLRWLDVPGLDGVLGRDDLQLLLTKFGTLERIVRRALVTEADPVAGVTAQQYLDQLSGLARGRVGPGGPGGPAKNGPGPIDVGPPALSLPPMLPQEFHESPPLLYQLVNTTLRSASDRAELADTLARLADVASEQLDWLVRETLGLGTHRLDAWHTSLASERLAAIRDGTSDGLYAGHYGFALDLRRADERSSNGFIHAPSLAHAASAAVLRSGWLARGSEAQDSPAAIDLARRAGARRRLAAVGRAPGAGPRRPARHVRSSAGCTTPVSTSRLGRYDRPSSTPRGSPRAALDLPVDGIELLDVRRDGKLATTIADLALPAEKRHDLVDELDVIESVFDAIDDVTTFESVHQLVVGNLDRAAAVLDGAGPNGGRPPELHGVRTPHGALTIDVRALVLVDAASRSASGWRGGTRDLFDPALDAWVAAMLPAPGEVGWVATTADGARVELRLDELAVSALDACTLASDDPTTLTPGLRRLAELARAKVTLVSHATADPGDAPVSLAELQLLAVELRRLVHESSRADERAVLPSDQALAPVESAPDPELAAADGLDALTSTFSAVTRAAAWSDLAVGVSEALARIGLVSSPTADVVEDFASLEARIHRRRTAALAVEQVDTWDGMRERIAALAGTAVPLLAPFVLATDGGIVFSEDLATADAVDDWFDLAASVHPNLGHLGPRDRRLRVPRPVTAESRRGAGTAAGRRPVGGSRPPAPRDGRADHRRGADLRHRGGGPVGRRPGRRSVVGADPERRSSDRRRVPLRRAELRGTADVAARGAAGGRSMDLGPRVRRRARDDRVDAATGGRARRPRRLRPRSADDDGARPARRGGDRGGRIVIGPWDRIEGSPHDDELDAGVEAHVADPLWLLARQWQVGELRADDAARPVAARLGWRATPVQTYRPGGNGPGLPMPRHRPLERVVEAAPPPRGGAAGLRWSTRLAALLARRLARAGLDDAVAALAGADGLALRGDDAVALPGHGTTAVELLRRRSFDGAALLDATAAVTSDALAGLGETTRSAAIAVIDESHDGVRERFGGPQIDAWDETRLEHRFALSAPTDDGEIVLAAGGAHGRSPRLVQLRRGAGREGRTEADKRAGRAAVCHRDPDAGALRGDAGGSMVGVRGG